MYIVLQLGELGTTSRPRIMSKLEHNPTVAQIYFISGPYDAFNGS